MDPTKKELYTAKRTSGVDVSSPAIAAAWGRVRSDESETNWCLLGYSAANCIDVVGSGAGGFEELLAHLCDDKALFGGLRAINGEGKVKFYFIFFVGKNLGGMARGNSIVLDSLFSAIVMVLIV